MQPLLCERTPNTGLGLTPASPKGEELELRVFLKAVDSCQVWRKLDADRMQQNETHTNTEQRTPDNYTERS
jgi:hypothetical protein